MSEALEQAVINHCESIAAYLKKIEKLSQSLERVRDENKRLKKRIKQLESYIPEG